MGNVSAVMGRKKNTKPRVVLESPLNSETDTTRVSFANKKSNVPTFKAKPKMTDIGAMHPDIYKPKVKFQRTQPVDESTNDVDTKTSKTSIRSTGSVSADGIWEPTLDPYERTSGSLDYRLRTARDQNSNNVLNYTGFAVRDYSWGHRPDNGLTTVEEI